MTDSWDEKPKPESGKFRDGRATLKFYEKEKMDAWLEKLKIEYDKAVTAVDYLMETSLKSGKKLEAIQKQVIDPQLKDSKEYLDAHTKPEPHDVVMSRYWLEKGIYGTVYEINKILGDQTSTKTQTPPKVIRK